METNKQTFPVKTGCTQCGHAGELFVSDEAVARELGLALRERYMAVYQGFMARRFLFLLLTAFVLGLALGWRLA